MISKWTVASGSESFDLTESLKVVKDVTAEVELRSMGSVPSVAYVALRCYDKNGVEIESYHNRRMEEPITVKDIQQEGDTTIVTLSTEPTKWYKNGSCGYYRSIGVYLKGILSKRPDFVIHYHDSSVEDGAGAYHFVTPTRFKFNKPLSQEQYESISQNLEKVVLMNHFASGTYLYNAASAVTVPNEWTTYSFTYTGEAFHDSNLRVGTHSVRLHLLANYRQTQESVLAVRNPRLSTNAKPL